MLCRNERNHLCHALSKVILGYDNDLEGFIFVLQYYNSWLTSSIIFVEGSAALDDGSETGLGLSYQQLSQSGSMIHQYQGPD